LIFSFLAITVLQSAIYSYSWLLNSKTTFLIETPLPESDSRVPPKHIVSRIFSIRGQKILQDSDLAELYQGYDERLESSRPTRTALKKERSAPQSVME